MQRPRSILRRKAQRQVTQARQSGLHLPEVDNAAGGLVCSPDWLGKGSGIVNVQPEYAPRRLLVSFAHPDDEAFGMGLAIAHYARQGTAVSLICATAGEAGDVDPERLRGFESVAALRLAELECAAAALDIRQVIHLGYRDSGMMGSPDNDHPGSLWQASADEVVRRVAEIIRRVRPQVVVTFDPYGGYGHPDHIAMHRATVRAFHEAGSSASYPEQIADGLLPYQPQKLYYTVLPRTMIRLAVQLVRLTGGDPRRMGHNKDIDMQAVLANAQPTTTRLALPACYDAWMAASACHASQQGLASGVPIPRFLARRLLSHQLFYRAWPEPNGRGALERDLFTGVLDHPAAG
jgi:LmbE family N-acetylglucosaminyl deacetylase